MQPPPSQESAFSGLFNSRKERPSHRSRFFTPSLTELLIVESLWHQGAFLRDGQAQIRDPGCYRRWPRRNKSERRAEVNRSDSPK
jgi:hypothetical protein